MGKYIDLEIHKDTILNIYASSHLNERARQVEIEKLVGQQLSLPTISRRLKKWNCQFRHNPYSACNTRSIYTESDLNLINGLLLGDATVGKSGNFSLATVHEEYRDYLCGLLPFSCNKYYKPPSSGVIEGREINRQSQYSLGSRKDLALVDLRDKWYPSERKIVPSDVQLSPLTVKHWFLNDGWSNYAWKKSKPNTVASVAIGFATNSFLQSEVQFLADNLKQIDSNLDFLVRPQHRNKPNQWILIGRRIRLAEAFFEYIGPSDNRCFDYKWKQCHVKKHRFE